MAKKKAAGPKKPAARKQNASIKPADYDKVGELFCEGHTSRYIAEQFKVSETTVRNVLKEHVWPAAQMSPSRSVEAETNRLARLEAWYWRRFQGNEPVQITRVVNDKGEETTIRIHRPHDTKYLDKIMDIVDMRCKIEGHYAAKRIEIEIDDRLRVAGRTPDESLKERYQMLVEAVAKRIRYEAIRRGEDIEVVDGELLEGPTNGQAPH